MPLIAGVSASSRERVQLVQAKSDQRLALVVTACDRAFDLCHSHAPAADIVHRLNSAPARRAGDPFAASRNDFADLLTPSSGYRPRREAAMQGIKRRLDHVVRV